MKINDNENIYVIADTHVGPYNNRTCSLRGFGADWISHMEYVITSINSTVKKQDTLYILGDLGFRCATNDLEDFIKSLKCRVKACLGNHDSERQLKKLHEKGVLQDFKHEYNIEYRCNRFHLAHFPKKEWPDFFLNSYHCYGHTHNQLPQYLRSMDVGIDSVGYIPIHLDEVVRRLKEFSNIDKYGKRIEL